MINDIQISESFNLKEFHCRHCQQVKLDSELLNKLQELRTLLNRAIVITSGFRCEEHNTAVGGAPGSLHMQGKAADIAIRPTGLTASKLLEKCNEIGFTGIGVYAEQGFVHVDIRDGAQIIFRRD